MGIQPAGKPSKFSYLSRPYGEGQARPPKGPRAMGDGNNNNAELRRQKRKKRETGFYA